MEDMREEIREAFQVFDPKRDGHLSVKAMKEMLQTVGDKMSEDDINELIATADANGDGVIDYCGRWKQIIFTVIFLCVYHGMLSLMISDLNALK